MLKSCHEKEKGQWIRAEFGKVINFMCSCCEFGFGWKNIYSTGASVSFVLPSEQLLGFDSGSDCVSGASLRNVKLAPDPTRCHPYFNVLYWQVILVGRVEARKMTNNKVTILLNFFTSIILYYWFNFIFDPSILLNSWK
jgi:hypothetical protein